jgi:hypothetical protein
MATALGWDIDLLIRTLQYSLLTGFGCDLPLTSFLQNLVAGYGGALQMVIVISIDSSIVCTGPHRVQVFIDRRFYRSKYDAESILAEFASATRNEMDIDRLSRTILNITDTTIRPAQLTLWLKK